MEIIKFERWQEVPAYLNAEQRADPYSVLEEFCEDGFLYSYRMDLIALLEAAMCSKQMNGYTAKQCSDLLFTCNNMQKMMEAVYIFQRLVYLKKITISYNQ
jgi:hypothetical protein